VPAFTAIKKATFQESAQIKLAPLIDLRDASSVDKKDISPEIVRNKTHRMIQAKVILFTVAA